MSRKTACCLFTTWLKLNLYVNNASCSSSSSSRNMVTYICTTIERSCCCHCRRLAIHVCVWCIPLHFVTCFICLSSAITHTQKHLPPHTHTLSEFLIVHKNICSVSVRNFHMKSRNKSFPLLPCVLNLCCAGPRIAVIHILRMCVCVKIYVWQFTCTWPTKPTTSKQEVSSTFSWQSQVVDVSSPTAASFFLLKRRRDNC